MSNKLLRSGRAINIAEQPPKPYRPAYTAYRVETVQLITAGAPTGWAYEYVSDPDSPLGAPRRELIYIGAGSSGTAQTSGSTQTRVVAVNYPAQEASGGVPAQRLESPPRGWTSFAHSAATTPGAATLKFRVRSRLVGLAVGFTKASAPPPVVGYGHLSDGLLFTDNKVVLLRDGTPLGNYADNDQFTIARKSSGAVTVSKNGTPLDTRSSQLPMAELATPANLGVSMYAVGDEVYDPEYTALIGGSAAMTLRAMAMFGGQGTKSQAVMLIPAATLLAGTNFGGRMTIPAMAMFGSDSALGGAVLAMPEAQLWAYGGSLPVVLNSSADLYTPFFLMSALGTTGETGSGAMTTPRFTMLAANRVYGESRMVAPAAVLVGYNEAADEAFASDTLRYVDSVEAGMEVFVLVMDGAQVSSTAVPTTLLNALAESIGTAEGTAATNQLLDALAFSFAQAGSRIFIPGLGEETWVYNVNSEGSTSYTDYGFNSYAAIGGKHYGANDDGLYLLEGDTDAGTPVRAHLSFGKLDFGSTAKKTPSQCYIGMSAKGNLVLKLIADDEKGIEREYLYKTRSFSDALRQERITPGKGLKANYFTVELFNENGADFEINSIEFRVADITKRIN